MCLFNKIITFYFKHFSIKSMTVELMLSGSCDLWQSMFFACWTAECILAQSRNLSVILTGFCQNNLCFVWLFWLTVQIVFYLSVKIIVPGFVPLISWDKRNLCNLSNSLFVFCMLESFKKHILLQTFLYKINDSRDNAVRVFWPVTVNVFCLSDCGIYLRPITKPLRYFDRILSK